MFRLENKPIKNMFRLLPTNFCCNDFLRQIRFLGKNAHIFVKNSLHQMTLSSMKAIENPIDVYLANIVLFNTIVLRERTLSCNQIYVYERF